jgi:acetyltransferase-like isoleucine patch superfamily enzyme
MTGKIAVSPALRARLRSAGIECFHNRDLPRNTVLEPPCGIKWMQVEYSLRMGAFSYAVNGYYFHVSIGRYTSIGEQVQIGRGDHPTTWLSTSPAFYRGQPLFDVGEDFAGAAEFHAYRPSLPRGAAPTVLKHTSIGNDVYIGHGAFIRPGIMIGDGAIIGACAVVTKDVAPYTVVAGNPAQFRKFRVPPELISPLLQAAWWQFAPWQLTGIDVTNPRAALDGLEQRMGTLQPYAPQVVSISDLADPRRGHRCEEGVVC